MKQIIILIPLYVTFLFAATFGNIFILVVFSDPYLGLILLGMYNYLMTCLCFYYREMIKRAD